MSLLILCNLIKDQGRLPDFMRKATIATIPKKGRLSQTDLSGERGIFLVSALRSICLRLAYNSKQAMINSNMSHSNIGGRRNKSCRNHIWILNAIIHDQMSSVKKTPIIFQQYDYKQMFDGMNLRETCNDLFDIGVKDDTLKLVYDANRKINFRVKTPTGMTDEGTLEEILLQGDTWASVAASVQCDFFGKELLNEEPSFIFKYKGHIPVGILGQVDDLIGVTEAGYKSHQMNAYLNLKTADKYLQFGQDKCKTMFVSKKKEVEEYLHSQLEVDTWKVTFDEEENMTERFDGKKPMEEVKQIKYLGVIISQNGSNMPDIKAKQNKALGTQKMIMNIIKGLGTYTFECGFIYLRSILRGSILYGTEVMFHITEMEKRTLEKIEESQMRNFFQTEKGCSIQIMYLDGGLVPARYLILGNKVNYLHYILNEDSNSLLLKFLQAQIKFPVKNDWNSEVKNILTQLQINLSYEEIRSMKKSTFKTLVRRSVEKKAFSDLINKQKSGQKGCEIMYGKTFEMADYLMPNQLNIEDLIEIFQLRSRTNKLPSNWGDNKFCETGRKLVCKNNPILNCFVLHVREKYNINLINNGNIKKN